MKTQYKKHILFIVGVIIILAITGAIIKFAKLGNDINNATPPTNSLDNAEAQNVQENETFKSVDWPGAEQFMGFPLHLDEIDKIIASTKSKGFDTVEIPISADIAKKWETVEQGANYSLFSVVDFERSQKAVDFLISELAKNGLKVIVNIKTTCTETLPEDMDKQVAIDQQTLCDLSYGDYLQAFKYIVKHYSNSSNVVRAYRVFNNLQEGADDVQKLNELAQQLATALTQDITSNQYLIIGSLQSAEFSATFRSLDLETLEGKLGSRLMLAVEQQAGVPTSVNVDWGSAKGLPTIFCLKNQKGLEPTLWDKMQAEATKSGSTDFWQLFEDDYRQSHILDGNFR